MKEILKRIAAVLHSRRFFWFILIFFVLESAWIALSAVYPQAFDEDFHFGLIRTYSHYWLPFLSHQPPNANAYGAMFRDPSFLYHYTMSFPYRLITLFTHDQTIQVIILRFIDILLTALGLILFRRVLLKAKLSQALTNVSMLIFVLIPIVPQVAGQVNYDNLLFPLVAWTCLLAMTAIDELRAKRPSVRTLLTLLAVCIFSSIVKYEFMPIAFGVACFVVYAAHKQYGREWRQLWNRLAKSWHKQTVWTRLALAAAIVIGLGLFAQRDGFNLIKYHTLEPDCGKVLSVQACEAYGPWNASYHWHQNVLAKKAAGNPPKFEDPITYTGSWFYWLWYRLFFAINGPTHSYKNYPPLPLPAAGAMLLTFFGAIVLVLRRKIIFSDPYLAFFSVIIFLYAAALWIDGYAQYRRTDVLVLMNGRYLLPILLIMAAILGRQVASLLRRTPVLKASFATLAVLLFLQGGGVFSFIVRSDATWDWPHSAAIKANNAARDVLRPVIVPGKTSYHTFIWFFN